MNKENFFAQYIELDSGKNDHDVQSRKKGRREVFRKKKEGRREKFDVVDRRLRERRK